MPLAVFPKCFLDALVVDRTMSVGEWVDVAADELDVDGLELYWPSLAGLDDDGLLALRRHIEARGLSAPMMCASPDFTQPDPAARDAEVERQRRVLHATRALGGRYCRVLSGQRRPEVGREEGIAWAAECIRALLIDAERLGVTLVLENHYKDGYWRWPEFAQMTDVFLDLLHAIPETPWFGVNYDPSNALIAGEDPLRLLELVQGRVVTMHASDRYLEHGTIEDLRRLEANPHTGYAAQLRHGVIGEGLNDYDRIFALLQGVGFHGWISIEDGDDPTAGVEHLRRSAAFLRRKMAEYAVG